MATFDTFDPHYDVGTATLSTANRTMTGQGTLWLDRIYPGDQVYGSDGRMGGVVETVNSNTSIALVKNWRGANQTAGVYTILRVSDSNRIDEFNVRLLNLLTGGNLVSLAELPIANNTLPYGAGNNVMGLTPLTAFARALLDDVDKAAVRTTLEIGETNNVLFGGRSSFAGTGADVYDPTAADGQADQNTSLLVSNATNGNNAYAQIVMRQRTSSPSNTRLVAGGGVAPFFAIVLNTIERLRLSASGLAVSAGSAENIKLEPAGAVGASSGTLRSAQHLYLEAAESVRSATIRDATTASAANAFVNGTNGQLMRSTSSARYKHQIEDADLAASEAIVFGARPVWYRSTCAADPDEWSYWGLIAEELAEIDSRLVHWARPLDDDGEPDEEQPLRPESVMYDRLVVHLINVVKRQQTQIDALTAAVWPAIEGEET